MCKVYNLVGSLTTIKSHLLRHNITEFNSLNEVITFQKNYFSSRHGIIEDHKILIEEEKSTLSFEIWQLNNTITIRKIEIEKELQLEIDKLKEQLSDLNVTSRNIIKKFINYSKKHFIKKKINDYEINLNSKISYSMRPIVNTFTKINNRHQYIISHFMDAIHESSAAQLNELERKKRLIDEINTSIYGALGEQKVAKELENLPDEYFLINDFSFTFSTPIYNRLEDNYIKSIQIDHVLIAPSGVFLIETKNWSRQSQNNLNFRSPVQQIKRSNYALFMLLNGMKVSNNLNFDKHHWGERKIPIKNLIVLTNERPSEEFQYVKILTLKELLSYVKYFKPSFSYEETQKMADFLLDLSGKR